MKIPRVNINHKSELEFELQKIGDFKPNDMLVLKLPRDSSDAERDEIVNVLSRMGIKSLIMPDEYEIKVWRG